MESKIELAQEEIDAIIQNKRKAREPKACYACHKRKVKCDRNLPCKACVLREHPELCSYERPSKRRQLAVTSTSANLKYHNGSDSLAVSPNTGPAPSPSLPALWVSIRKTELDGLREEIGQLKETISALQAGCDNASCSEKAMEGEDTRAGDEAEREGIHAQSGQMATVHLGSRSVLAYMMGLRESRSNRDEAKTLLEENILPKLGLDNETATYPFVDLWSTEASTLDVQGLVNALPDDAQCRQLFASYRDVACTIYPVIPDTASFAANLNTLLTHRAFSGGLHRPSTDGVERPFGVSLSWLGLLFAVLASGCQSSDIPAKERELTSQVYICCAYQALRMTNFMTHPSVEAIQAFLVIGNVLSYNMNPGVSYILLGATVRMAFSLGLQIESHHFPPAEQYLRRYVWWVLAWQDSHFSISYDRPSSTTLCGSEIPSPSTSRPGHRSYAESMMWIVKLTQDLVRGRILAPKATMTIPQIIGCKEKVARIVADGEIHLRDRNHCFNQTQHLQRLALKLHSSYITSELCRPALKSTRPPSKSQSGLGHNAAYSDRSFMSPGDLPTVHLRQECIINLKRVIKAYLEMYSICFLAARSWIGLQRTVSAAFLLVVQEESRQDPKVHILLRDLEAVMTERTRMERTSFDGSNQNSPPLAEMSTASGARGRASGGNDLDSTDATHWARPMTESLKALSKLNAALATPANGGTSPYLSAYNQSGPLPSIDYAGRISGPRSDPTGAGSSLDPLTKNDIGPPKLMFPITPESASTSSGDWNFGNMVERAGEFVQPALWE